MFLRRWDGLYVWLPHLQNLNILTLCDTVSPTWRFLLLDPMTPV